MKTKSHAPAPHVLRGIIASSTIFVIALILFPTLAAMQSERNALVNFTISGNVKSEGTNLSGATVSLTGSQTALVSTGADGNYSFTVPAGGNYTVSVYKLGIVFTPASQTVTNLQTDTTANFQNGTPLCAPPSSGLVAWWRAENTFTDSSGFTNNGTPVGGVNFVSGKVGQAFTLT